MPVSVLHLQAVKMLKALQMMGLGNSKVLSGRRGWQGVGWQGVISVLGVKYKSPRNENNLRLQMQRNAPGSAELSSARR